MTKPLAEHGGVLAVWRVPFAAGAPRVQVFDIGATVLDMVRAMDGLPPDFMTRGVVALGGHEIERKHWRRLCPKIGQKVTFHYPLGGGGGGRSGRGGKAILGIIVAVATLLTAGLAAGGFFGTAGGWFAAGSTSAKLLAGGISLIGGLAQSAISAPPAAANAASDAGDPQRGAASASGNLLARGAAIPRVVGTRWIFPSLGAQPFTYRDGPDEFVEAVFVLAGPHKLEDIQANRTAIEDAEDLQFEVREGWADDTAIGLVNRYAVTRADAAELMPHEVDGEDQGKLKNQANPTRSVPRWTKIATSKSADEIRIDLTFPGGLYNTRETNDNARLIMPIRLRGRIDGGAWINLPELIYASAGVNEIRATIRLRWGPVPSGNLPEVPVNEGFVAAYKHVTVPVGPSQDWDADASFSAGAGNDSLYRGNEAASNVRRVVMNRHDCLIWLDPAVFTAGTFEIETKRGAACAYGNFTKSSHQYSAANVDFFAFSTGEARIPQSRVGLSERLYLVRSASVFERHPIKGGADGPGLAVIAIKAKNRQIDNLRVKASGYVPDWNGVGWTNWVTTSNPAPHFRYVLNGDLTPQRLETDLIDNDSLVEWRQACIDDDDRCDLICEGAPVNDVLSRIAGCGYARPRMSETWGVIRDYDRSAEDPVQIFTMRNSRGLSMAKGFPLLPDALRASFKDATDEDKDREVFVWRPGREGTVAPRIEMVTYQGICREAKVIERATFDLMQSELRSAFWSFGASADAIRCQRGDLVAVNHDVLDYTHGAARIADVEIENGHIVAVSLDAPLRIYDEPMMEDIIDMTAVEDMSTVGLSSSLQIRKSDGSVTPPIALSGATGERDRLPFASPLLLVADNDGLPMVRPDMLAQVGRAGSISMRLVVSSIDFDADLNASITGVDEAPELFAA